MKENFLAEPWLYSAEVYDKDQKETWLIPVYSRRTFGGIKKYLSKPNRFIQNVEFHDIKQLSPTKLYLGKFIPEYNLSLGLQF